MHLADLAGLDCLNPPPHTHTQPSPLIGALLGFASAHRGQPHILPPRSQGLRTKGRLLGPVPEPLCPPPPPALRIRDPILCLLPTSTHPPTPTPTPICMTANRSAMCPVSTAWQRLLCGGGWVSGKANMEVRSWG